MTKREREFIETVWEFYREHKRRSLPWRKTKDPYKILVSEVMLQQTQVERVIPKYRSFIRRWPTVGKLAGASLGEVLKEWQGLGYNRRAKFLHQCTKAVVAEYADKFPRTYENLKQLPGVGPYTAGAIMAFAYNQPVSIIETNIRTVYLHHFFPKQSNISDTELLRLIAVTMDTKNPREWYWALMDYGAYLKKELGNQNARSKHYQKQSTFKGSDRQIRGAILRALSQNKCTLKGLRENLKHFNFVRLDSQLRKLLTEKMIEKTGQKYQLPR